MATLTAPHPPASAPPGLLASLTPSAKFGRPPEDARDLHADALAGRLSGQPAAVAQLGCRPRALSVVLDDPAAAALSLRTHMEPADLMELTLILAEAAAEVLRARRAIQSLQPPPTRY